MKIPPMNAEGGNCSPPPVHIGAGTCGPLSLVREVRHSARITPLPMNHGWRSLLLALAQEPDRLLLGHLCLDLFIDVVHPGEVGVEGPRPQVGQPRLESCSLGLTSAYSSFKVCQLPSFPFPACTCMCTCVKFPPFPSPAPRLKVRGPYAERLRGYLVE